MHNCAIFYEDYGENYIEQFELKYRKEFKKIISKKIKDGKLNLILTEYLELK